MTAPLLPARTDTSLRTKELVLAAAVAVAGGSLAAVSPPAAAALAAVGAVGALAFCAPVAHLTILLFLTAIVPYSVLNSVGGGAGAAGLLPTDLFIITGLARAFFVLLDTPLERLGRQLLLLTLVLLGLVSLQFLHGLFAGRSASEAGAEVRTLIGFGTAIIALPIVLDPQGRRRLVQGLLLVGLLLGMWGLAQRGLGVDFGAAKDVGVRKGVTFTDTDRGGVQGGLYGFPVAVVLSFAALASGAVRSRALWVLLAVVGGTNVISLIFTYERTFWVATVLAVIAVAAGAGPGRRLRSFAMLTAVATLSLSILAVASPGELGAVGQRLASIGQYSTDDSVRSRTVESGHVFAKVRSAPLVGSGLGDAILWGRPWQRVQPRYTYYTHNGYLWLAWKLGVPLALLLIALIATGAMASAPRAPDALARALRNGARAALLASLLIAVTFPVFNTLAITPTLGVLLAVCFAARQVAGQPSRAER